MARNIVLPSCCGPEVSSTSTSVMPNGRPVPSWTIEVVAAMYHPRCVTRWFVLSLLHSRVMTLSSLLVREPWCSLRYRRRLVSPSVSVDRRQVLTNCLLISRWRRLERLALGPMRCVRRRARPTKSRLSWHRRRVRSLCWRRYTEVSRLACFTRQCRFQQGLGRGDARVDLDRQS